MRYKCTDYYDVSFNVMENLIGSPEYVGGNYHCYNCNLVSLEGSPKYVGGNFFCEHNDLSSLEGAPKVVGNHFVCYENNIRFFDEDVRNVCKVGNKIYTGQHKI